MVNATQISLVDYTIAHKNTIIDRWGEWRDAQGFDDAARQLVDDAYGEYIRTLDKFIDTLLPF